MRSSKLFVSIAAILFLFTSLFYAQSDSVGYKSQLQFHLVNGYSLSYLNSLSNSSALRYKLDFNLSVGKENSDGSGSYNYDNNNASSSSSTSNSKNNSQFIDFAVQYLWYPLNESIVRIFLGTGPFISFNRRFSGGSRETDQYGNRSSYSSEMLNYSLGIGIGGVAGVECFVTKQISLIGEYSFAGSYMWTKNNNSSQNITYYNSQSSTSRQTTDNSGTGWNLGLGNLKLGIAFRF